MVAFARHPLQSKPLLYAISAARYEASRFVRLGHMPATEYEDIAQDILVAIVQKWPAYDSDRSAAPTFISIVAKRTACTLSRARVAAKRGGGRFPVSLEQCDCRDHPIGRGMRTGDESALTDSRLDVQHVVAGLPRDLRRVAMALMTMRPTSAAKYLRISPRSLQIRIAAIRDRFTEAGLGQ